MSLKLLAESHVESLVLNDDHFAEAVERIRESEPLPVVVTALVTWAVPEDRSDKGKEARLTSTLTVATDSTLKMSDRWKIGENYYATLSVSEPQDGVQTVTIARIQGDLRTGGRRVM